jgi:hypothetical protein
MQTVTATAIYRGKVVAHSGPLGWQGGDDRAQLIAASGHAVAVAIDEARKIGWHANDADFWVRVEVRHVD